MISLSNLKKMGAEVIDAEVVEEEIKRPLTKVTNKTELIKKVKQSGEQETMSEINRILDIEIQQPLSEEQVQILNEYFIKPECLEAPKTSPMHYALLDIQVRALYAFINFDGGFMPISVGGGKTLVSLLIAYYAFREGTGRSMLIIPPNLVDQLRDVDLPNYRSKTLFSMPVHFIAGLSARQRVTKSRSGARGLYIFTFSLLSSKDGQEILENIDPELVIIDEAHNLSGARKSARSRRFNDFLDERNPNVVALSGTMSKSSPIEYHRTARHCLGEMNFLPNIATLAQMWSDAIGSSASSGDRGSETATVMQKNLLPLIRWARDNFPEEEFETNLIGFRRAFCKRIQTNPAVTSSGEDHLDINLHIHNDPNLSPETEPGWDELQGLIEQVEESWVTPSGEEIEHGFHLFKWMYELDGAGFYNELFWPEIDWIVQHRGTTAQGAETLLEKSKEYHEAHQEYARNLRNFIEYNAEKGLDTPSLIGLNMFHNGSRDVGESLYMTWLNMKEKDFEGRLDRSDFKRAIRVCPFKVNQAVRHWENVVPEGEGCIYWFYSNEVGRWLREVFQKAGHDPLYCPAGSLYNKEIIKPEHAHRPVIASMTAHGTGKNLQHFGYMRYVQYPVSAVTVEQSLGREHRNGQKRKDVHAYTDIASDFDRLRFYITLTDAAYNHQAEGNKQRLIDATFHPMPEKVPYEVMTEWGLKPKRDREVDKLLTERFGG